MIRLRRWVVVFGLASMAAALLTNLFVFWSVATAEGTQRPERLDAIVVLTGGPERVRAGLDLLAAGAAPRLFVSGAHRAVAMADILRQRPDLAPELAEKIELGRARNTVGNARETQEWAAANGVRRIALVTAYYHMPRSLALFRRYGPALEIWPVAVEPAGAGGGMIALEWLKYLATVMGIG